MARKAIFSVRLNASERRLVDMAALEAGAGASTWAREILTEAAVRTLREAADAHEQPETEPKDEPEEVRV